MHSYREPLLVRQIKISSSKATRKRKSLKARAAVAGLMHPAKSAAFNRTLLHRCCTNPKPKKSCAQEFRPLGFGQVKSPPNPSGRGGWMLAMIGIPRMVTLMALEIRHDHASVAKRASVLLSSRA